MDIRTEVLGGTEVVRKTVVGAGLRVLGAPGDEGAEEDSGVGAPVVGRSGGAEVLVDGKVVKKGWWGRDPDGRGNGGPEEEEGRDDGSPAEAASASSTTRVLGMCTVGVEEGGRAVWGTRGAVDGLTCAPSGRVVLLPAVCAPEDWRWWERAPLPDSCTEEVAPARVWEAGLFSVMDSSARSPLVKAEEM